MSIRMILAASAVLAFAAPALAQDAPPAPPAAPAIDPAAQAAFEAKGEAFEAAVEQMTREMQAAATAAGADTARANTDLDAIAARYQPVADAFANDLEAFVASQLPAMPAEAQAQMAQMGPMLRAQITGVPAATKAGILQAQAAPAPAAPQ
ncbi:translation initiation factor IF-2 [Brevundimonas sp.]|uniref:translation initiation factor IF-2 n=1 Tax=Brevundimonas sp. TaxID=1871086 RepID=UPI002FCB02B7